MIICNSVKIKHCDFSFKKTVKTNVFWFQTMKFVAICELK